MRLIDANALANYANNQIVGITANDIMRFPTVDARPVKHGRWSNQMLFDDGFGGARVGYICSACKKYVPFKGNFCGECGARMDGEEREQD